MSAASTKTSREGRGGSRPAGTAGLGEGGGRWLRGWDRGGVRAVLLGAGDSAGQGARAVPSLRPPSMRH
ncbi:unnamed protein product [Coccothraustes coccothraustes]